MTIVHRLRARTAVLCAAVLGAVLLSLSLAPPANAAPAYRFWGYFQLKGDTWSFAQKGADQTKPADGAVEGWRYALAAQTDTRTPRDAPTFGEICAGTKAKKGTKRVGLVLDFGRPADAGSGAGKRPAQAGKACAQVPTDATGAEVLAAATGKVRVEKGMTCAILDWPAKGCGGQVKDVPAAAKAKDKPIQITAQLGTSEGPTGTSSPSGAAAAKQADQGEKGDGEEETSPLPFVLAGGAIVLLLGAAAVVAKRRRQDVDAA